MQFDGINTNEEIRGIIKTRAPSKERNFCICCHDPSLKNMRRALCVGLEEGDDNCYCTTQGVAYGQAGEDKAIEDRVSLHQVFCRLLYHTPLHFWISDNFQPRTPTTFWQKPTQMFSHSQINNQVLPCFVWLMFPQPHSFRKVWTSFIIFSPQTGLFENTNPENCKDLLYWYWQATKTSWMHRRYHWK